MIRNVHCIGYAIREYTKNGMKKRLGLMYVITEDSSVVGRKCEEIAIFEDLVDKLSDKLVNQNLQLSYNFNNGRVFLNDITVIK